MPTEKPDLYLTFDDGPVFGPTEFVLETLKKYSVKATFFCIGDNVLKHPEVFRQIIQDGHAVGNHTFHHLSGWKFPVQEYVKNVEKCDAEIAKHFDGPASHLFRPPYGRITRTQVQALKQHSIIMWDVLSFDFLKDFAPEKCLRGTIRASRPGSIVVFHDSLKAEKKLTYALPRFVEHFLGKGYTFRKL